MTIPEKLQQRARLYQRIRAFFSALNYLEVDTPLLAASTNTDVHIESISACVNGRRQYLQTSPEFAMKRLLAAGSGSIYQICHAFRNEEQGRLHRAEFTLLEWYSLDFDYQQLMTQLQALIKSLTGIDDDFERIRYADCFQQHLGLDIFAATLADFHQMVALHIPAIEAESLSRQDCMDLLLSQLIARDFDGFTFVYDYPAQQASLARISPRDARVAERFELFYHDMELANGFSELTDAREQRRRFEQDNETRKQAGLPLYPIDEAFLAALDQGMPDCAGVALGLDRLLMLMHGADSIDAV